MENRAVLAAVLMAALLILYQVLFVSSPAPPPPASAPEGVAKPVPTPGKTAPPPAVLPPARPLPRLAERTVAVDTPLYHAIVGSEGGRLLGWTLHYRGEKVLAERGQMGLSGLILERPGVGGAPVEFTITGGPVTLDGKAGEDTLVMTGEDAYGVRVRQTATFRADQYAVDLAVRLENGRRVPSGRARSGRRALSSTPVRRSTGNSGRTGSRARSTSAGFRSRAGTAACRWSGSASRSCSS